MTPQEDVSIRNRRPPKVWRRVSLQLDKVPTKACEWPSIPTSRTGFFWCFFGANLLQLQKLSDLGVCIYIYTYRWICACYELRMQRGYMRTSPLFFVVTDVLVDYALKECCSRGVVLVLQAPLSKKKTWLNGTPFVWHRILPLWKVKWGGWRFGRRVVVIFTEWTCPSNSPEMSNSQLSRVFVIDVKIYQNHVIICYLHRIHVIFWCTLIRSTLPTLTWGMELMLTALVWPSSIWTHAIQKDSVGQNCYGDFRWVFLWKIYKSPKSWWLPSGKERIVEMYEIHQYIEHHHMMGFCLFLFMAVPWGKLS